MMAANTNDHAHYDRQDTLTYLRKESGGDVYNRLHSIEEDIQFVRHVRNAYPNLPIFPNLRCGAWYTDPELDNNDLDSGGMEHKNVPVYFKSTDGHFNNWSFNLRRANLHLLPVLSKYGGMILVDSTRSGKRMPDAFSKTVPIWCAVINRAVRVRYMRLQREGEVEEWDAKLYTPPGSVSVQEHCQIENRIDGWVGSLLSSSFDIPRLQYPLRPFWITPSTSAYPTIEKDVVIPILCVSASKQESERRNGGYTYIQGSGDDHEMWGMGLDPNMFWKHRPVLLEVDRSRLVAVVENIVVEERKSKIGKRGIEMKPISRVDGLVSIGNGSTEDVLELYRALRLEEEKNEEEVYVLITSSDKEEDDTQGEDRDQAPPSRVLHFSIPAGKKGQVRLLETVFPCSVEFVRSHMMHKGGVLPRICCVCDSETGYDRSAGVAVVLLQTFFDDSDEEERMRMGQTGSNRGCVPGRGDHTRCHRIMREGRKCMCLERFFDGIDLTVKASKESVGRRLEWVVCSEAGVNPTRRTLKRVNEHLMSSGRC